MGTLGNPKTWAPYMKPKDCTQGFCTLSCLKWCYIIFPPPPPPPFAFPDDNSQTGPTFSPLMIAIIGILASAFVLLSYYAIISKYCGNSGVTMTRDHNLHTPNEDIMEEEVDHNNHDDHPPWVVSTVGLDEALIKSITLVKYNKGDGLVGSTSCSVCLGEFIEDDTLRLLPTCNHVFHVACIDTWLKSHSNCPLCRANIVLSSVDQDENQLGNEGIGSLEEGREMCDFEQESGNLPKCPFRGFSDRGELGFRESRSVIEIADHGIGHMMRRSISMDHSNETRVSVSDILRIIDHEEELQGGNFQLHDQSLKCVMSSVAMKRSISSGRILFSKHGR